MIGHEITHGFDDEGRHTDSTGLLRDWWTAEDAQKNKAQAGRLSEQYSAFEPLPGLHVNGALTLGEDIADTGAWRWRLTLIIGPSAVYLPPSSMGRAEISASF